MILALFRLKSRRNAQLIGTAVAGTQPFKRPFQPFRAFLECAVANFSEQITQQNCNLRSSSRRQLQNYVRTERTPSSMHWPSMVTYFFLSTAISGYMHRRLASNADCSFFFCIPYIEQTEVKKDTCQHFAVHRCHCRTCE
jgi:hypothetical protein